MKPDRVTPLLSLRTAAMRLACLIAAATGCATRHANIDTAPTGARVSLVGEAGKTTPVGEAPLRKPLSELALGLAPNAPVVLRLEKEGYFPAFVVLEPGGSATSSIVFKLEPRGPTLVPLLREAVSLSFEAERMLMEKRYEDARVQAKKIQEKFPGLAIGWVIEATALELQGKRDESLPFWRRAMDADPEDPFLARMLGETPAANGAPAAPATAPPPAADGT